MIIENDNAWFEENPTYNPSYASAVPDFKVNDDLGMTYQGYSNIATDLNGDFVVCWFDKRNGNNDIYIQLFDYQGTRLGTNRRVNDDPGTDEQFRPSMMKDQSGKFVVCWQDYRANGYPVNADIYGQRFDATGTPQLSNFKTNDDFGTETQGWQDIDAEDFGNFVVVWEDNRNGNYDIYAQRYHKSGVKLGSNFRVNDDVGTGYQHNPKIAVDGDGDFVITWYDNRSGIDNIMGQRYNASGAAQGSNFLINDIVRNEKHVFPDVACDYDGNFTVVWIDYRNGNYPNNPDVYGRMYWANGSTRSGNFRVNSDGGSSMQAEVTIGMDYLGNFIAAWRDDRLGNFDIYAQYYHNAGNTLGGNYRVNNDNGTSVQSFPNVTMDGINIYLTWTDERNGNFDVYAKIMEYGSPSIVINPISFQFTAERGGSNPSPQNLYINNIGYGILNWIGQDDQSWLSLSPGSGAAPDTASVAVNITGLSYGNYTGRITIRDASGEDSSRVAIVSLDITAPVLSIDPDSLAFSATPGLPPPDSKLIQIQNSGSGTLHWSISVIPSWLDLSNISGTAPSVVDVTIDPDSLPQPGSHSFTVTVTSPEAVNSPQSFTVTVSYQATSPILAIDPDTLHFSFQVNESHIADQELLIYNVGIGQLQWSVGTSSDWTTINPSKGFGDAVVNIGIVPGQLPAGEHYASLAITDSQAFNSPIYAVVHASVADVAPIIDVSPDSISFLCYYNGPQDSARSIAIQNLGGGSLVWNVLPGAVWLGFSPNSDTGEGITYAQTNTSGLPIATYSTWSFFNSPTASNLRDSLYVDLTIAPWLPLICGLPQAIDFKVREYIPYDDTVRLTVSSCAAPNMTWSASESLPWISLVPSSGQDGTDLYVLLNAPAMNAGDYQGSAVISSPEASNSPQSIAISLRVLANDTIRLSSAAVAAGGQFSTDLSLRRLLPLDSLILFLDYETDYFHFDSLSEREGLTSGWHLSTTTLPIESEHQLMVYSSPTSLLLPVGSERIATIHFTALAVTPIGDYSLICTGALIDSLGVNLAPVADTAAVEVSTTTPAEPTVVVDIPAESALEQNYPNPFNEVTLVRYTIRQPSYLEITVFNILGLKARTLVEGWTPSGIHSSIWDGKDEIGQPMSSGIYFIRLKSQEETNVIKAVLLK